MGESNSQAIQDLLNDNNDTLMKGDSTLVKLRDDDSLFEERKEAINKSGGVRRIFKEMPDIVEGGLIRSVRGPKKKMTVLQS